MHALSVWLIGFVMLSDTQRHMPWRPRCAALRCALREAATCQQTSDLSSVSVTRVAEPNRIQNYSGAVVISPTTWPLPVSPSASITSTRCQSSPTITETSARLGTHLHVRRQTRVSAVGVGVGYLKKCFLPLPPSRPLMRRLARTPAPKRFAIPTDGARAGGQAPLEMSAADDARPRAICPPPSLPRLDCLLPSVLISSDTNFDNFTGHL